MFKGDEGFSIKLICQNKQALKDDVTNKKFLKEIEDRLNTIEKIVNGGINYINCIIIYGVKDWNIDSWVVSTCNASNLSKKQDLKISVGKVRISNIKNDFENFLKSEHINVMLYFLENDNIRYKGGEVEQADKINTLNLTAIEPKYSFNQLIINEDTEAEIKNCVKLVKNRKKIYNEWGFSKVDKVPHSTINFYGPPGTGKTMSAHILASELGLKILPLNYADIESKYVGDAPKNLVSAFNIAEEQNALLFFDEADSFLGKRVKNVNSSSDQSVNSLRSQLLILLEGRDVVTVFASNLIENYDSAFNSRIIKHIKFELPDFERRKRIISMMIPTEAPLKESDRTDDFFNELSTITEGLAPRELKNAILNTLVAHSDKDVLLPSYFIDEFKSTKLKFDELNKTTNKKEELSKRITKSIEENNFNVVKKDNKEEQNEIIG